MFFLIHCISTRLYLKKVFLDYRTKTKKREYRASKKVCLDCPLRKQCLKKSQEKRITITYYREEYERNNSRIKSTLGRKMKATRQSTVEPVFGTLTQFMGLRKINPIGLVQADKVMHMAAVAYNLKKYLKFITKKVKSDKSVSFLNLFNTYVFKNKQMSVLSAIHSSF